MSPDPASIAPVARAAARASRAWRAQRAFVAAAWGLGAGLLVAAALALGFELARADGLLRADLPTALLPLLLAPLAGLAGALRPLAIARAARELDRRGGLDDRLGTALEFAADPSALARWQRRDAAQVAGIAVAPLFPLPWGRVAPALALLVLLFLGVVSIGLGFDLSPAPAPPSVMETDVTDDLLAAIETETEVLLAAGDKDGAKLLDDMARTVRKIRARREELKRKIAERREIPPDAPVLDPVELEPAAPVAPQEPAARDGRITAADLERLEAATAGQIQMTDAQMGDLVSELFSGTRTASKMMEQFHHHVEDELDTMGRSYAASQFGTQETGAQRMADKLNSTDMLSQGAQSSRLSEIPDVEGKGMDMIRRDLSGESQASHDAGHDMQHSFNEFLEEFVKDMQSTVAEAAMGKKAGKNGREVKTNARSSLPDKRDAMAESGMQEMSETGPSAGEVPSEPGPTGQSGKPGGEPGDSASQSGPPPEDLSNMKVTDGQPGDNAIAMKADAGGGKTSAGASGAGTGDPNAEGGRSGTLTGLARLSGPLDEVLGSLGEGNLPTEERKQLFDRLARHSVQAGLASEADDVLLDYFAEAEELISEEEELSPLFRDYATSYFEAIRPGGARDDAPPRPASDSGAQPRPVP